MNPDLVTAAPSEAMASEHWRPQYFGRASDGADVFAESFYEDVDQIDEAQLEEDRVLYLLLEAFPGISLETLAAAYARAGRDPNLAAEIITTESTKQPNVSPERTERQSAETDFGKYGVFSERVSERAHLNNFRSISYSHQLKNGHGDFSGASVWRDSPILGNHGYLPDSCSASAADGPQHPNGGNSSYPRIKQQTRFGSSLSADAPSYEFPGRNLYPAPVSVPVPPAPASKSDRISLNGKVIGAGSDFRNPWTTMSGTNVFQGTNFYSAPVSVPVPIVPGARSDSSHLSGQVIGVPGDILRPCKATLKPNEFHDTNLCPAAVSVPVSTVPAAESDINASNGTMIVGVGSDFPELCKAISGATLQSVSTASQKLTALSGSVSSQRHGRTQISSNSGGGTRGEFEKDLGLYAGNLKKKKKKKAGTGNSGCDLDPEDLAKQKAEEDFLHSMLGGDIGIDVVRDVLGHYAGDTDKALETLLHIGSTSGGFSHYSTQKDSEEDIGQATNTLWQVKIGLENRSDLANQPSLIEGSLGNDGKNDLLNRLQETFPTVELSFLAVVLEAANFSYGEAVKILKESGVVPVGSQMQEKLDPADVLKALFRTDSDTPMAGPSTGSQVSKETWSVVAAKARVRRNPEVELVTEKLTSQANGAWNDYSRQRASANEHWTTMKNYMKEAAAAYGRGDRALAGVLSEKGSKFKKLALEASERASKNIFNVKNKDIENNITIDLHSQHVTDSLQLLKLHLRSLSQIPSVDRLTVITGQGSHSAGGRAKIKPALTRYLEKKKIPWTEPNAGCILIKMSDVRELEGCPKSSDSSSESESY